MARLIVLGFSIMKDRSSRNSCSVRLSTKSSSSMTFLANAESILTKASNDSFTMMRARSAM